MSDPWFKFYASDWLAGTMMLTAAERGIYISLIAAMYDAGGPIPNEPRRLARLAGASNSALKKAIQTLLEDGKLELDESGYLFNSRVKSELRHRSLRSEKARVAGEKSQQNQQPPSDLAQQEASHTRSQKPEADTDVSARGARKRATRLPEDWVCPSDWLDYAERKGLTRKRAEALADELVDWSLTKPQGKSLDWKRTYQNWARRAVDQGDTGHERANTTPQQRGPNRREPASQQRKQAWLGALDELGDSFAGDGGSERQGCNQAGNGGFAGFSDPDEPQGFSGDNRGPLRIVSAGGNQRDR